MTSLPINHSTQPFNWPGTFLDPGDLIGYNACTATRTKRYQPTKCESKRLTIALLESVFMVFNYRLRETLTEVLYHLESFHVDVGGKKYQDAMHLFASQLGGVVVATTTTTSSMGSLIANPIQVHGNSSTGTYQITSVAPYQTYVSFDPSNNWTSLSEERLEEEDPKDLEKFLTFEQIATHQNLEVRMFAKYFLQQQSP